MSELAFPVLGAALVVLCVLPAAALLGLLLSVVVDRARGGRLVRWGGARHALLTLPCLLPLVWVVSAGVHQAEPGRAVLACMFGHEIEQLCLEPLLFVVLLLAFSAWRLRSLARPLRLAKSARLPESAPEAVRVAGLIRRNARLKPLIGRWLIARDTVGGCAALGLLRPVVALDAQFVRACDDEALVGALSHELEHVRGFDPLRYWLLAAAVRLVPFGEALLGRSAAAWLFSREVECDRAAVLAGAAPLGVAQALLRASRPASPVLAHIGGAASRLRLRVELLLAYAEARPRDDVSRGRAPLVLSMLLAVGVGLLPHAFGAHPLDFLHTGLERLMSQVFLR